jgi:hypothetical protein
MAGKKKEGVIQIILVGVALLLIMALLRISLGISLTFGVWIWSIISVITMKDSEFENK